MNFLSTFLLLGSLLVAQALAASLESRSDPVLTCGNYATANKRDVMNLLFNFKKVMKPKHGDDPSGKCAAKAKSCSRISCWNTSGLYDSDKDMEINCYEASLKISEPGGCCKKSYTLSNGISGELKTQEGWRFIVAYANCNNPSDGDPKEYKWSNNSGCED